MERHMFRSKEAYFHGPPHIVPQLHEDETLNNYFTVAPFYARTSLLGVSLVQMKEQEQTGRRRENTA